MLFLSNVTTLKSEDLTGRWSGCTNSMACLALASIAAVNKKLHRPTPTVVLVVSLLGLTTSLLVVVVGMQQKCENMSGEKQIFQTHSRPTLRVT